VSWSISGFPSGCLEFNVKTSSCQRVTVSLNNLSEIHEFLTADVLRVGSAVGSRDGSWLDDL
jgi:hypothetical protein